MWWVNQGHNLGGGNFPSSPALSTSAAEWGQCSHLGGIAESPEGHLHQDQEHEGKAQETLRGRKAGHCGQCVVLAGQDGQGTRWLLPQQGCAGVWAQPACSPLPDRDSLDSGGTLCWNSPPILQLGSQGPINFSATPPAPRMVGPP
jgi:hypothetical protein